MAFLHRFLAFALCCASAAAAAAGAPTVQTVEVKVARERLVPYKDLFYPMAKAVRQHLAGRVALGVQLRPAHPGVRTDDLAIWLDGAGRSLPVQLDRHGLYLVPVEDEIAAQDGSFSINKKPSDLRVNLVLVPTVADDAWTIGAVRSLLEDIPRAIDPLVPWHHRLLTWAMTRKLSLSVCSPSSQAHVDVVDGERLLASYPITEATRNHVNAPVYCRRFDGKEPFDARARLVLPEGAQVLFI
ncbi:hypothetical protein [Massilia sp. DD77]|uniref:hypothetical protein n=1 Tax=Massilia sp. DD77 TaxID=3109349 RepID=UPI002FFE229C